LEPKENVTQTDSESFPARKGLTELLRTRGSISGKAQTAVPEELTLNFEFKNSNYRPSNLNKPSVL